MESDGEASENGTGGAVGSRITTTSAAEVTPGRMGRAPWTEAWRDSNPLFGTFIQFPSPATIEIIGHAGLDFVIIDLEHGEFGVAELPGLCRAAKAAGVHPIVRVATNDPVMIGKSLDFGASAVLIPHIDTPADAAAAVAAAKYPPMGTRGAYPVLRAAGYGAAYERGWEAKENERPTVILLIESTAGIDNIPAIMKTPGVDGIFIGPVDLSQSMGLAGEAGHPRVQALVREIGAAAVAVGLHAGTFCPTTDAAASHAAAGFKLLAHGVDSQILLAGYTEAAKAFQRALEGRESTASAKRSAREAPS